MEFRVVAPAPAVAGSQPSVTEVRGTISEISLPSRPAGFASPLAATPPPRRPPSTNLAPAAASTSRPAAPPPPPRRTQATGMGRKRSTTPPSRAASSRRGGDTAGPSGVPASLSAAILDAVNEAEGVITNKNVRVKITRSFPSVRTAMTEQRSQSSELRRQTVLSMPKVDELAVGMERSLQNYNFVLQKLASIKSLLEAADTDRSRSADGTTDVNISKENTDNWVRAVRKDLQRQLKTDFAQAIMAWEVFQTVEVLNAKLLRMGMAQLNVPSNESSQKLMSRVAVPVHKNSTSTLVACRYLKRTINPFFETVSRAAFTSFIIRVKNETNMGSLVRKTLEFSPTESAYLLDGDRFIHEGYDHNGHLDGGFALLRMLATPTSLPRMEALPEPMTSWCASWLTTLLS